MIFRLIFVIITLNNVFTNDEINFNQSIPFCINKKKKNEFYWINFVFLDLVVMKPHTIINQTLHSYCKEQYEFNTQPMFINLTEYCLLFFLNSQFKIILF
jgi:hypothetical protein